MLTKSHVTLTITIFLFFFFFFEKEANLTSERRQGDNDSIPQTSRQDATDANCAHHTVDPRPTRNHQGCHGRDRFDTTPERPG